MPSVRAMVGVVAVGRGATDSRGRALTIVATLLLLAMASMPAADAAKPPPGGGPFTTFSLAGTPPAPAGTVCPGSGSACTNLAAEPAIRASRDGSFIRASPPAVATPTSRLRPRRTPLVNTTSTSPA